MWVHGYKRLNRHMWLHRVIRHMLIVSATVLFGGFFGATLVRVAPGFGVDEQQLDTRLSNESVQAIRHSRDSERDIFGFYTQYLGGLFRGNLGFSHSLGRPVTQLLAERVPVTFYSVIKGLVGGWLVGLVLALSAAMLRSKTYDFACTLASGFFLCLPSAVLAILFLLIQGPVPLGIGLTVFPKIFRYARNLLVQAYALPHVLTAQSKGLSGGRILFWHVLPLATPQLVALAGASVTVALGAAIPIEVVCDSPGIGQLAWLAALGRDLPVLVVLTILVTVITVLANATADLAISALRHRPS